METHQTPPTAGKSGNPLKALEDFLELYLVKKAPFQLPLRTKELIVKIGPWIDLILILLFLPLLLGLLGLNYALFSFMSSFGVVTPGWTAIIIIGLISFVLQIIALPGLFKRSKNGWNFLFYSDLLIVIQYVMQGNVANILFSVIGLYFLFQVREYYRHI